MRAFCDVVYIRFLFFQATARSFLFFFVFFVFFVLFGIFFCNDVGKEECREERSVTCSGVAVR